MTVTQCVHLYLCRRLAEVQLEHQNGKERGITCLELDMVDGARHTGLSDIFEIS